MKIKLFFTTIIILAFLSACSKDEVDFLPEENSNQIEKLTKKNQYPTQEAIPEEYIIVFKESLEEKNINNYEATQREGSQELLKIQQYYKQKSLKVLSDNGLNEKNLSHVYTGAMQGFHAKGVSSEELKKLETDKRIEYIEPNYIVRINLPKPENQKGLSEDELLKQTEENSKMNPIGGGINTLLANGETLPWGVAYVGRRAHGGTGRTAWVLDTGIAPHPDLRIRGALSRSFVNGEASWRDLNGHGTHVAGTIAAKNNGRGVIGVSYGSRVVAVKVLNRSGSGSVAGIIAGIDYVYNRAVANDVFNYSIGFRNRSINTSLEVAMRRLAGRRIYGALAAGNNNDNTQFFSPQRLRTARTWIIGAINRVNKRPIDFSNFGVSVDRWAPGEMVTSTWLNGRYNTISGTSMASPHVAGILLARGTNSVGSKGFVAKGGHRKPRAKL